MTEAADREEKRDWTPSAPVVTAWLLGGTVLTLLSGFTFLLVYGTTHSTAQGFSWSAGGWSLILGIVGVLVLHEALHGVVFWSFGCRPSFGVGLLKGTLPYFYCTAPGCRLNKRQFVTVGIALVLLISAAGLAAIAFSPFGSSLVVPCAMNVGGSIGDLWLAVVVLRQPRGTQVEDLKTGVRFHRPTVGTAYSVTPP